ncbi:MAG TPA: MFS transporter [Chryseosolibacter sp.]|nr:MFS transporter [Chryseosolibacter sp.]
MTITDSSSQPVLKQILRVPVLVAALGYFVDMYDLFLFSIVRVPSLRSLGLSGDELMTNGIILLDLQMAGLLIGGILWGVMGDKRGRLSVLFGSILTYSLANIGNGFVTTVEQYAVLRFIAGIGLAGELGAGITLVTEILPKKIRGYGTTLVATMGVLGAITAYFVADALSWRMSYFVGGGLGLLLMIMRVRVFESSMFDKLKSRNISRGNIMQLFATRERTLKYLQSILIGLPMWCTVGVLITFSPEFGRALAINGTVDAGQAVMIFFGGQVAGDIVSGLLSQRFQRRKSVIFFFILISFTFSTVYLLMPNNDLVVFYVVCALLGFGNGYWTLFVTVAAELFGTNLRATVATTVPNFVRGSVIPITLAFQLLKPYLGIVYSAFLLSVIIYIIALVALKFLEETFSKDLNYAEQDGNAPASDPQMSDVKVERPIRGKR